ncbi:hypothetical protein [Glycomyces arizonensis]|uniref:hypothetical protein n=1 Tax=Glycomyces arizonensis TaxID=256035 RepID=UPI0003F97D46|nr:hypothetical protein [Glycomyces arizonensis]
MPVAIDEGPLAELAVAVWRLRSRAPDGPVGRHALSAADALAAMGVEARGYDGAAYSSGLQLRVLAFQPTAGLAEERVLETVSPAVYLRGKVIRMGEVIVGIPETEPEAQKEQGE